MAARTTWGPGGELLSHPRIAANHHMTRAIQRSQSFSVLGPASNTEHSTPQELPSWFPRPDPLQALGSTADLDVLIPLVHRAVAWGHMTEEVALWGILGHLRGFDIGLDVAELPGFRNFNNHPSADLAVGKVSSAIGKRVSQGKTLGPFPTDEHPRHGTSFPIASILKRTPPSMEGAEPEARPVSDHKRSLTNSVARESRYRQDTTSDLDASVKGGVTLGVQDVANAFPTLPLLFTLWPYFLFQWNLLDESHNPMGDILQYYLHVCADFGTATLPFMWWFYLAFFCFPLFDILAIRTPEICYCDDLTHIFDELSDQSPEDILLHATQAMDKVGIALNIVGASEKPEKRHIGTEVRDLGWIYFTENSPAYKVFPDEKKQLLILDLNEVLRILDDKSTRYLLPSKTVRSVCGQILHAQGDPYMQPSVADLFALLRAAELSPSQNLTIRRGARRAFLHWRDYLEDWDGKLILHNEHHQRPIAPPIFTDASGGAKGGGGYVTFRGSYLEYSRWSHDKVLRRRHINYLEGWAVLKALQRFGPQWQGCDVPLYIDNLVFHDILRKKRSPSTDLNDLMIPILNLCKQYDCRLVPFYISTDSNILADALSRHRLDIFWNTFDEFVALPWWGNVIFHTDIDDVD